MQVVVGAVGERCAGCRPAWQSANHGSCWHQVTVRRTASPPSAVASGRPPRRCRRPRARNRTRVAARVDFPDPLGPGDQRPLAFGHGQVHARDLGGATGPTHATPRGPAPGCRRPVRRRGGRARAPGRAGRCRARTRPAEASTLASTSPAVLSGPSSSITAERQQDHHAQCRTRQAAGRCARRSHHRSGGQCWSGGGGGGDRGRGAGLCGGPASSSHGSPADRWHATWARRRRPPAPRHARPGPPWWR